MKQGFDEKKEKQHSFNSTIHKTKFVWKYLPLSLDLSNDNI